jgi:Flp pilus assembly protein TadG
MTLDRIARSLKAAAARFGRAERGNVAMMFAVTLPVLLTSIGTAIDYSRAVSARSAMQAAVDATALMISKEASTISDPVALKNKAYDYFAAIYNHPEAAVAKANFSIVYTPNSGSGASVKVDAAGSMQTDFMKFANITQMPLTASSTTKWGNIRYRVALALDNTGSMASASKMTELKSAANNLITDFYNMAGADADVYISIVPFSRDVNVGTTNKNETWLRWTDWDEVNGSCSGDSSKKTKTACNAAGRVWNVANHNTWNGCVMDRDQNYDTTADALANSPPGVMAPAHQYGDCPVSVLGMTPVKSQKQTLLDKIDDMIPVGTTNQSIGMFWAWQTLRTSGPFTGPSKNSSYTYMDVIILLTDGLNTENRFDSGCTYWGTWLLGCSHEPAVDARQALLCDSIKTAGVKVFAIQVATDNDAVSTVTKNCTSEPNNPNYFSYITQASQMTVKFQNIFKELAKLRVSA